MPRRSASGCDAIELIGDLAFDFLLVEPTRVELASVADVVLERRLRGDGFRGLAAIHRRAVATLSHALEHRAPDTKGLDQPLRLVGGELTGGAYAHRV